jgi:hypothetical protein
VPVFDGTMIRRTARLRREYLYRKSLEVRPRRLAGMQKLSHARHERCVPLVRGVRWR